MTKVCTKCHKEKDEGEFFRHKSSKDGLSYWCRSCQHDYDTQRKDKKREYNKTYVKQHRDEQRAYDAQRSDKKKQQYRDNIEKVTEQHRIWRENNKDYIKKYREQNRDVHNVRQKERYHNDCKHHLSLIISNGIRRSLKDNKAGRHWEDLVDYTLDELRDHLESQFDEHMNWDNMGTYWEIDHIIPQNLFKFESPEDKEFKVCWSLRNLRPLEWRKNRQRPKDGSDISDDCRRLILGD